MTILTRLRDKGEVTRRRRGRAFEYAPVSDRDERVARRVAEVLDVAEGRSLALARFVARLPPASGASLGLASG